MTVMPVGKAFDDDDDCLDDDVDCLGHNRQKQKQNIIQTYGG